MKWYLFWFVLTFFLKIVSGQDSSAVLPSWGQYLWRAPYRDSVGVVIERFKNQVLNINQQACPANPVVFVGSSSIRGWRSLGEDFPELPVCNCGFGGSTLPELSHYLKTLVLDKQPSMVVVYCGENDLTLPYASAQEVFGSFLELMDSLKRHLPKSTPVVYLTVKPSLYSKDYWPKQQQFNQMVTWYASHTAWKGFRLIDLTEALLSKEGQVDAQWFIRDGLHLNKAGYRQWVNGMRPKLYAWYKKSRGPDGAR